MPTEEQRKINAVHKALGCDWIYLEWDVWPMETRRIPSRSPGHAAFRICPVCGKWQQRNLKGDWTNPHMKKTRYYFDGLRIAREFVDKGE